MELMVKEKIVQKQLKPSIQKFKAMAEMPGVSEIMPQSQLWHSIKIGEMLKDIPYLLDMIKGGKAKLMHYDEKSSSCEHKARISGPPHWFRLPRPRRPLRLSHLKRKARAADHSAKVGGTGI